MYSVLINENRIKVILTANLPKGFVISDYKLYNTQPISASIVKSVLLAHPNHKWDLRDVPQSL